MAKRTRLFASWLPAYPEWREGMTLGEYNDYYARYRIAGDVRACFFGLVLPLAAAALCLVALVVLNG